jgi:EAL domain-containing protein (putative c-di-GMP-specific phosphodiesterase class I)
VPRCLEVNADLVLLDLQMPYMDGFAVMSELRAALPAGDFVPILVLTADTSDVTRDRALDAGATDFLTKPFDRTEVVLRVRNLLETRRMYSQVQRHNAALRADLDRRAQEDRRGAEERRQRSARIDTAVSGDAISMVFQPMVDLQSREVRGVEALARFAVEPARPPNEWFAEAASIGRGLELELTAVQSALAALDRLPTDVFLSVNVSPEIATTPELANVLATVPPERVVVELTEHAPIPDYDTLLPALDVLRAEGVRIAVDDAGAGYSGLRHVLRLRPEILKLDIALTRGIDADPARRALARALAFFAREIDAMIIAEGIETAAELETLRQLGIAWGQGFYVARPGPLPLT